MLRAAEPGGAEIGEPNPLTAALGALVQLWRIEHGLSVVKLAHSAAVDVEEIQRIEENEHYQPDWEMQDVLYYYARANRLVKNKQYLNLAYKRV